MAGERTPLLDSTHSADPHGAIPNTLADGLSRVASAPLAGSLNLDLDYLLSIRPSSAASPTSELQANDYAYSLSLLLQLRDSKLTSKPPSVDIYSRWNHSQTVKTDCEWLERLTKELWARFLAEYRTEQGIDCVLWTPFVEGGGSFRRLRVVDFLVKQEPPIGLLTHPLVEAAIERRWNYGRSLDPTTGPFTRLETALSSPRNVHAFVVLSHLVYLGVLASYLLYPPDRVTTQLGRFPRSSRLIFILIFLVPTSLSSISLNRYLSLAALVAFTAKLPSCPQPEDGAFEILLFLFGLNLLALHLPQIPSPALLKRPSKSLPLSIFMGQNMTRTLPTLAFFGPVLLLSVVLLSFSLDGYYLTLPSLRSSVLSASPLETRWAILILLGLISFLWIVSAFMMTTVAPSLTGHPDSTWERYGPGPARRARFIATSACITFGEPYCFPPPLNAFSILVLKPLHYGTKFSIVNLEVVARLRIYLWRIIVLPFLVPVYILCKALMYF